jgi:hypothetical protein
MKEKHTAIFGICALLLTYCATVRAQWVKLPYPNNPTISVFVLTGNDLVCAPSPFGLAHTTDNGDTWIPFTGLPTEDGVGPISFARSGRVLLTYYEDFLLQLASSQGNWRSNDSGKTWSHVGDDISINYDAFMPFGGYFFSVKGGLGVVRSSDSGITWKPCSDSAHDSGLRNYAVGGFDTLSNELFATTNDGGIYRSLDTGQTWHTLNSGIEDGVIFAIASQQDYQFAATESVRAGIEVFRRHRNEDSWTKVFEREGVFSVIGCLTVKNNFVFAGDERGNIYGSSDTGVSWSDITPPNKGVGPSIPSYIAANDSFLFAGEEGVFRLSLSDFSGVKFEKPADFTLDQNYPNPATSNTTISFDLQKPSIVSLIVTDELGRQTTLVDSKEMNAGRHTIPWDVHALATGMYTYRLIADGKARYGKMLTRR